MALIPDYVDIIVFLNPYLVHNCYGVINRLAYWATCALHIWDATGHNPIIT